VTDRAITLANRLDALDRVDRGKATRDRIADAIMTRGWNEEVRASPGRSVATTSTLRTS
jgi:hypothetical protein